MLKLSSSKTTAKQAQNIYELRECFMARRFADLVDWWVVVHGLVVQPMVLEPVVAVVEVCLGEGGVHGGAGAG